MKSFEDFSKYKGKDFISVDIQQEYMNGIYFRVDEFTHFLNETAHLFNDCIFFYNGDSMGMSTEQEYIMWLYEYGLEEDTFQYITFYDKGYAFFRYCMDYGIDHDEIKDLVQFMYERGITDSRLLDDYTEFLEEYPDHTEIVELMEDSDDPIIIPEFMDFLKNQRLQNILITGGGVEECLAEVEIALSALGLDYEIESKYTY